MTLNDAILLATGGPTVNDGLLAFFIAGGATGPTLPDAERQWLCLQLSVPVSVNATNQDLWMQRLASYPGALNDKLFQFWSTPQSLTDQVKALFANGEQGGMWDATDMASLFQDSAGTTPVTALTQPIGRLSDISGNANHLIQSTAGWRPQYTADGALFDGVDDSLRVSVSYSSRDWAGATLARRATGAYYWVGGPVIGTMGAGILRVDSPVMLSSGGVVTNVGPNTYTNFERIVVQANSGVLSALCDGIPYSVAVASTAFASADITVGGLDGNPYFGGVKRSVLVDRPLSGSEVLLLDAWLAEVQ